MIMWYCLISTSLIFGVLLYLAICLICTKVNFDVLSMDDYRHIKLKHPYDYVGVDGWYDTTPEFVYKKYNKYRKNAKSITLLKRICLITLSVLLYLGLVFGFASLGAFCETEKLKKEVAEYEASKFTIEQSLKSDNLSGFERIELVKIATEKNDWLEKKQYEVKQWYRFYLKDDLVLSLEKINFETGGKQ